MFYYEHSYIIGVVLLLLLIVVVLSYFHLGFSNAMPMFYYRLVCVTCEFCLTLWVKRMLTFW